MSKLKYGMIQNSIFYRAVDLINLFVCIYMSDMLMDNPVFGAAIYISAMVWISFNKLYGRKSPIVHTRVFKITGSVVFCISIAIDAALLIYYPSASGELTSIMMAVYAFLLVVRSMITDRFWIWVRARQWIKVALQAGLHCGFIGAVALIFYNNQMTEQELSVAIGGCSVSGVILFFQQLHYKVYSMPQKRYEESKNIYSYNIYSNMSLYANIAFNLSIMTSSIYMLYSPAIDIRYDFSLIIIWILLVLAITRGINWIMVRGRMRKVERSLVFLAGALCWAAACIILFQNAYRFNSIYFYTWTGLWALGAAAMFAVMACVKDDLKLVTVLLDEKISTDAIDHRTDAIQDMAMMISSVIVLMLLAVLTIITVKGDYYDLSTSPTVIYSFRVYTTYLPVVFVFISLIFTAIQPIDKRYYSKLLKYSTTAKENCALKDRLNFILVKKNRKRIGIRILRFMVKPLFYHKVIGKEKVDDKTQPVVFVCNHGEVYGPVATALYLPFFYRPWIINKMIDKQLVTEHMFHGTFARIPWMPKPVGRLLSKIVSPIVLWILNSMDPIPVYRGSGREVLETIRLSAEALEYDDNLLVFPENPDITKEGVYAKKGVVEFYTGFVNIAKTYYKRTGRAVCFYPVYCDKAKRTVTIEQGIVFTPKNNFQEEKQRISKYLEEKINEIAFQ